MFQLLRQGSEDVVCTLNQSSPSVKIGRDPKSCSVALGLNAVAVSRVHADLSWTSNDVTLTDNSSFGTIINGDKIVKKSKLLFGGESIKIGQSTFTLIKVEEKVTQSTVSNSRTRVNESMKPKDNKITSFFNQKSSFLPEDSSSTVTTKPRVLVKETPSESLSQVIPQLPYTRAKPTVTRNPRVIAQETPLDSIPPSKRAPIESSNRTTKGKARRINPLFESDEEDDIIPIEKNHTVIANDTPMDDCIIEDDILSHRPLPSSSIATQVIQRSQINNRSTPDGSDNGNGPPKKKMKSLFFSSKPIKQSHPQRNEEKCIVHDNIDDDDIRVIDEPLVKKRKDKSPPPSSSFSSVVHTRSKRNVRTQNIQFNDDDDDDDEGKGDEQFPDVITLASMLCSSFNDKEDKSMKKDGSIGIDDDDYVDKNKEEIEKVEKRIGDETLDMKTQSQIISFTDGLVRSQLDMDEMSNRSTLTTQGKGFKKFTKARQGRFYSIESSRIHIIGGSSDLIDFRKINY